MNSQNNYCVIMAGGVGSRFWPYSRNSKPKQFLDFMGTGRSLLQMTFDRCVKLLPAENILIVSNVLYKDLILEQLPQLNESQVLLEPVRRNTAPCIAYAVHRIYSINPQARMLVTPADHLVMKESEFLDVMQAGLDFVSKADVLLTIGIRPNRPETGYGYIQQGEMSDHNKQISRFPFSKVSKFTEKPSVEVAKTFIASGDYLWNAGVFIWSVEAVIRSFNSYLPEVNSLFQKGAGIYNTDSEQQFVNEIYPQCQSISIDYGIMEKAQNTFVLEAEFGWSDLGTWESLYDISNKDESGNATLYCRSLTYESSNNLITLPANKLAVIEGLNDYLIAESDNVLLICKKDAEARIRTFVEDADKMFEGEYN